MSAPLSEDKLRKHLTKLGLPRAGIEYVVGAAATRPARLVGNGAKKNMPGEMPSLKPASLGDLRAHWRLQFESISVEFPFAVLASADPNVLMMLDQPTSVPLTIVDKNGRKRRIKYTADYLTVTRTDVRVIEVKSADGIAALCASHPSNWTNDGPIPRYLPAEQAYADLGVAFQVVVAESLSWHRVQNILFQRSLPALDGPIDLSAVQRRTAMFIQKNGPCSISDVVRALELPDATNVLRVIGTSGVHVDIDNASLSDPHSKIICASNGEALSVGSALATIQKEASTSHSVSLEQICDPKHLARFGYRIGVVTGNAYHWDGMKEASPRTMQRWKAKYKRDGLEGIRPRFHKCGPQEANIGRWHDELLQKHIKKYKGSTKYSSRRQAHIRYAKLLARLSRESNVTACPVGYSTYCSRWAARKHSTEDGYNQGGTRQASAVAPHADVDTQVPIATRPFQVAHIDHCLAPSWSDWKLTGQQGKPWLTTLIDAKTGEALGRAIRFENPSFDTDALALRDCVRRHGRLPSLIVSDGGTDFRSAMFQAMLAELSVTWVRRSYGNPRSGQPVERPFLTFAQTVCRGRDGFAPDIANLRSISRKKDPANGPKRIFESLLRDTDRLLFAVMPRLKGADGSPSALEERSEFEDLYGLQGVPAKLDLRFLVATSRPLGSKGTTEPSGAIRMDESRYYSTKLHGHSVSLRSISLRRDPEDATVLYFCLGGAWHVAKARAAMHNRGRSDEQVSLDATGKRPMTKEERKARIDALHDFASSSPTTPSVPATVTQPAGTSPQVSRARHAVTWAAVESIPTIDASRSIWRRSGRPGA
ncbi:integrase catalytic domain-containing protein [Pseudoxanthomonas wuyuanensis]